MVKLIESPRDAIHGLKEFIPTQTKADYINALLKVGLSIIDFGSFVSEKSIPQLKDTSDVLEKLDLQGSSSKLMVVVGNVKGGAKAAHYEKIDYLAFPSSISETFLKLNILSNFEKTKQTIDKLLNICDKHNKQLIVYISMAFGNPYGDEWSVERILNWVSVLQKMGVNTINLSDITGVSTKKSIQTIYSALISFFPDIEFGFHLHTTRVNWYQKIDAAYLNGCKIFDSVLGGLGGCPMSGQELLGNLPTENMLDYFDTNNVPLKINRAAFKIAKEISSTIFSKYK